MINVRHRVSYTVIVGIVSERRIMYLFFSTRMRRLRREHSYARTGYAIIQYIYIYTYLLLLYTTYLCIRL